MDQGDVVSSEHSDVEQSPDLQSLREQVETSERALGNLDHNLQAIDAELEELAGKNHQYELLEQICNSLEELDGLGSTHLFWGEQQGLEISATQLRSARRKVEDFGQAIARVEERRRSVVDEINGQNEASDYLHYDLRDALEREEKRKSEWLVEREPVAAAYLPQIMPWARGLEEDRRFRRSLRNSLAASFAIAFFFSALALPVIERATVNELPERVAKLVRQKQELPPPPIEEPAIAEQELPEPEPDVVDESPPEESPITTEEPKLADAGQPDTKEQVKSKGILAFRDSFADRANMRPSAQLGFKARVTSAGEDSVGRPQRLMVATSAPGSSGGINLANISRDVGGGGGGMDGVMLARVASSIGGGVGPARPRGGGALAGRTDEEIQIVFDRYKSALYRLYNRELRKNPTLRGQLVLRLTIEPDGTVSLCEVYSSDMKAPVLSDQVVQRVRAFDFGAKEDIVAMTIIYPIDFLPAA